MTGGFAVSRAQPWAAAQDCVSFAAAPTAFQTTLLYLEPFAWPAALAVLGLAIVAAALILRRRRDTRAAMRTVG